MNRLALIPILFLAACAGGDTTPPTATPVIGGLVRPTIDSSHSSPEVQRDLRMGQLAATKGKPDVALMMFHTAALSDVDDPAPRLAAAETLEDLQDYAGAATLYQAVIAQGKITDPTLRLAAGRVLLKQQNYPGAATQYQALAGQGGDWRAFEGLGIARAGQHDAPAMEAAFTTALASAPGDRQAGVRANWARARIGQKDYAGTVALLEPEQKGGTATAEETKLLALSYGYMGRVADAQALGLAEPPVPPLTPPAVITPPPSAP